MNATFTINGGIHGFHRHGVDANPNIQHSIRNYTMSSPKQRTNSAYLPHITNWILPGFLRLSKRAKQRILARQGQDWSRKTIRFWPKRHPNKAKHRDCRWPTPCMRRQTGVSLYLLDDEALKGIRSAGCRFGFQSVVNIPEKLFLLW